MRMDEASNEEAKPADAVALSPVDRAPRMIEPYLRLARIDRPIGSWLLFWPCAFGVALGLVKAMPPYDASPWRIVLLLALFGIGSIAMRGAGCTYNDIADRDIDARVERTRDRPLPAGRVSLKQAIGFLALQMLIGLGVLLYLRPDVQIIALSSLALVAIYPFMKRITYYPQIVLGLAFNWGALVGYSEITGAIDGPGLVLYGACVLWTIGYDTIYAHQDKADDIVVGVKSTALKFGRHSKRAVFGFYWFAWWLFLFSAMAADLSGWVLAGLGLAGVHFIWQVVRLDIDDPLRCLEVFRANRDTGAWIFLGLFLGAIY